MLPQGRTSTTLFRVKEARHEGRMAYGSFDGKGLEHANLEKQKVEPCWAEGNGEGPLMTDTESISGWQ